MPPRARDILIKASYRPKHLTRLWEVGPPHEAGHGVDFPSRQSQEGGGVVKGPPGRPVCFPPLPPPEEGQDEVTPRQGRYEQNEGAFHVFLAEADNLGDRRACYIPRRNGPQHGVHRFFSCFRRLVPVRSERGLHGLNLLPGQTFHLSKVGAAETGLFGDVPALAQSLVQGIPV